MLSAYVSALGKEVKDSARFGVILPPGEVKVDFPAIMKRMRSLRAGIAPHDGVERYCKDFCEQILLGKATFGGPDHVFVEGVYFWHLLPLVCPYGPPTT